MPAPTSKPPKVLRVFSILFWVALWGLAAFGAFFLALFIAGEIQFATLGCGPRRNWGEDIYSACSDIDESGPIFLLMGLKFILPLAAALLIRFLIRCVRGS